MSGMLAAKAILGGIGGAMTGAASGQQGGQASTSDAFKKFGESLGKQIKKAESGKKEDEEPEKKDALSDGTLKDIYGDNISDSMVENFAKLSTIDFTYKPEAQEEYKDNPNVDDREHVGVIAQELEANPVTSATVETDEKGHKLVNTDQLAMADTAVIAELSRRILTLEVAVKELINRGK